MAKDSASRKNGQPSRFWSRLTEVDAKVGELDKSVGVLTTEMHATRSDLSQVDASLSSISNKLDTSIRELVGEINKVKSPNWAAFGVLIPALLSTLMGISYLFYREIDHARREVEHASHIGNLKHIQTQELRKAELTALEYKLRLLQHTSHVGVK